MQASEFIFNAAMTAALPALIKEVFRVAKNADSFIDRQIRALIGEHRIDTIVNNTITASIIVGPTIVRGVLVGGLFFYGTDLMFNLMFDANLKFFGSIQELTNTLHQSSHR